MDAKMYVGNLSYDVTQEELQALFEAHGAVSDVFIVKDRESGRPRGFAFVTMEEKSAMDAAIEALNGEEFMGRNLAINEARPREDRPRGGGGGGYGGGRAATAVVVTAAVVAVVTEADVVVTAADVVVTVVVAVVIAVIVAVIAVAGSRY